MEEFDYVIEHPSGKRLPHVDVLSRSAMVMAIEDPLAGASITKRLEQAQEKDEHIQVIKKLLAKGNHKDILYKYEQG